MTSRIYQIVSEEFSVVMKDKWADEDYKRITSEAMKKSWTDPTVKMKKSEANLKMWSQEGRKEKMGSRSKSQWGQSEYRLKVIEGVSKSMLTFYKNEQNRERVRLRKQSLEFRLKVSTGVKESWTDERKARHSAEQVARWDDSIYRHKMADVFKLAWDSEDRKMKLSERMKTYWSQQSNLRAAELRSWERSPRKFQNYQVIYEIWESSGKPSYHRLSSLLISKEIECENYDLKHQIKKFKEGYIPQLDQLWLDWLKENSLL